MGPYAASKAAVAKLTEALAEEVKDRNITVNAILPSIIDTAANRADMPKADFSRWVQPGQIALAWTLSRPGVTSPIFGPTQPEHVDAALAALALTLTKDEIAKIDTAYRPRPAAGHGI